MEPAPYTCSGKPECMDRAEFHSVLHQHDQLEGQSVDREG